MRRVIYTIIISFCLLLVTPSSAYAACEGLEISGSGSILGDICFGTFSPFRGIASGGLPSALAELFTWVIIIWIVLWFITVLLNFFDYLQSQGQGEGIERGKTGFSNMFKGLSMGLGAMVLVAGLGAVAGYGLPFDWPDEFYQCGVENEILYSARERINELSLSVGVAPGTPQDVYCCKNGTASPDDGWYDAIAAGFKPDECELFDTFEVRELQ